MEVKETSRGQSRQARTRKGSRVHEVWATKLGNSDSADNPDASSASHAHSLFWERGPRQHLLHS